MDPKTNKYLSELDKKVAKKKLKELHSNRRNSARFASLTNNEDICNQTFNTDFRNEDRFENFVSESEIENRLEPIIVPKT